MNNGMKKALLVGCGLISIIILVWYFGLHKYVTLASMQSNRTYLEAAVAQNYWQSVIVFIAIYIAVIAILIPGVPPLTILGGFLFGFLPGVVYSAIGAAVGATISFLLMKYVLSNVIKGKYAQKLERFNAKIAAQGPAQYLLTMQLIGLIPYFIINTLAALANVSLFTFFWTVLVGSLPTVCVYAFAGRQLHSIESARDIFSPQIIVALALLALLSLLPLMLKYFDKNKDF
jgi:uncharacterized membrane protein YdjX (TVP38/TMEM64 family)